MLNHRDSKKAAEDIIRYKLLSTKDWKIKTGCLKRSEYELQRRETGKTKPVTEEVVILPFGNNQELDKLSKPKHSQSSGGRGTSKQTMTRFSRVFKKSVINAKNKASVGVTKLAVSRSEEITQLQELAFDKTYFNRVLWDEHVRMLFLRSGKIGQSVLKSKPQLRLWMETILHDVSERSHVLRNTLRHEMNFLSSRYQVQRQLHFWQTLHSLTLDQLYHKKCQYAFRRKIRHDTLTDELNYIWRWFNQGLYLKVEKACKPLIISVSNWVEKKRTSIKFKILTDLFYVRGLSLMHLKKYKSAYKCFRKDGEIGAFANLKPSIDRTKDNMGRIYAIRGNYRQAIKLWSERLVEVVNPKEKAWMCYGIAQCFALLENYEKAIEMSNRCITNADQVKSYCWELNGNLLLAHCTAMLGSTREANIRNYTLISLKAINRAYLCAVFLANVSVIRKIVDIVVHIYNSFKDIDISILEDVWSPNLLDYARKASLADDEKLTETKNMNINNTANDSKPVKSPKKKNKIDNVCVTQDNEPNECNNNSGDKNAFKKTQCKMISNTIVNVCLDDIELHSICSPKEQSKNQMSLTFCTSPITAVEVISSDEHKVDSLSDDWITESEYEDDLME